MTQPKSIRRKISSLIKHFAVSKSRIALERDKLRAMIDEAEAIDADLESAIEHLDQAADALSNYL